MNKLIKYIYVGMIVLVLLMPVLVLAQVPQPTVPVTGQGFTLTEIELRIKQIAQFLIVMALVVAVIFIIWGGVTWMAAMGNEEKAKKAKTRIKNGIIGALIILGVGVILQTLAGLVTRQFFS